MGFIFRTGYEIKDFGERLGIVFCIRLGIALIDYVMNSRKAA